ncbi:MAG: ParB N-terminal domain-containing protein [Deltaproteobacteria bacterium]|nr:MAG: ParB N-terminal domain-containing protein [Deltaproteobacteria bacterium]
MMQKPLQSTLLQVAISDLDLNPGPFCMSFNFSLEQLKNSIERFGVLNAPYVIKDSESRYTVVTGYRRLLALRELGWPEVVCHVLPSSIPPLEALLLNLYDNIVHRKMNEIEKAMVLVRLNRFVKQDALIKEFMPMLGIPANKQNLDIFLQVPKLEEQIRISIATQRISLRVAGVMMTLDSGDRLKVNELFTGLKLSFNQQWEAIQWIVEIASREGRLPKEILEDDAVMDIVNNSEMSNPIKSKTIVKILRKRRFPSVVKAENAFKKGVSRLSLPQGLKIIPPPFFEGKKYRLEIGFSQGEELKEKVESLFHLPGLEHITDFWKDTN